MTCVPLNCSVRSSVDCITACPDGSFAFFSANKIYRADIEVPTNALKVTYLAGSADGFCDGQGSNAQFRWPTSMVARRDGSFLVADFGNDLIRHVTAEGCVSTYAGTKRGYQDGDRLSRAEFMFPTDVAVTRKGNVVVSEGSHGRIRVVSQDFVYTVRQDWCWDNMYTCALLPNKTILATDGSSCNLPVWDYTGVRQKTITTRDQPMFSACPDCSGTVVLFTNSRTLTDTGKLENKLQIINPTTGNSSLPDIGRTFYDRSICAVNKWGRMVIWSEASFTLVEDIGLMGGFYPEWSFIRFLPTRRAMQLLSANARKAITTLFLTICRQSRLPRMPVEIWFEVLGYVNMIDFD